LAAPARLFVRADVGVRPAVESAGADVGSVIGNELVAEAVALVDDGPERAARRLPGHPDRIAQSRGEDSLTAAIGIHLQDGRAARILAGVDVRRGADTHVQLR